MNELKAKILELELLKVRESLRPHHMYHTSVGRERETGNYFCRLMEFDQIDEEPNEIIAFGATPAEACDNFDKMWIGND